MAFMMSGQPSGGNWLALFALVVAAVDFVGLSALFITMQDRFKRKDKR